MKTAFYTIAFLIFASFSFVFGQKKNAYGSNKGIYILNTIHPANKGIPFKNGVNYLIERSVEGKNEFTVIANYSTPSTVDEFVERANSFRSHLPYETTIDQAELLLAWKKYESTISWDSLKYHLSFNYVAAGFGVMVLDSTARKNTRYSYRISLVDPAGTKVETINSNPVSFPENMTYTKPKFHKETTDGISSTVIWKSMDTRLPHHFKVYRSTSEKGDFEEYAISKSFYQQKDTLYFAFTDNNMNKGSMYRYFISPSNNYGNYTLFSDTVLGTNLLAKDAGLPTNLNAQAIDSLDAIKLTWKIENPFELDAIELYKGIDYEKPFDKLISLTPTDTVFIDRSVAPGQRYFYTLKVIDRLGRASITTNRVFGICNGSTKPLTPVKVIAKATEKGVRIQWIPNGESIRGFYVFRCEGIDGEFVQLGDFIPYEMRDSLPSFVDSDAKMTAGATYSYTIKQENNGHLIGDASKPVFVQPIHLKTNIQLPLVQFASTKVEDDILLSWNISNSINGVYGINVLRQKTESGAFSKQTTQPIEVAIQSYLDSTVEKNTNYNYKLSFVDHKGDELAVSNTISSKIEDYTLASPFNLRGSIENNQVKLTWESSSNNATEFKIYKRIPGKKPEEIGRVKSTIFSFVDAKMNVGETTLYYITSVNKVTESKGSNEWKLVVEE